MIELRTLGTLELDSDTGPRLGAVLAQPRRTALLCYLALGSPRGLRRRDSLYAMFWPENGAEQANHALRQALYFLRRHLGVDAIVSRSDGSVGLSRDRVYCDAVEFEALLDSGKPEPALALYRGELLPGFHLDNAPEFERWLEEERVRLHWRAAEAAWVVADARERDGEHAAAAEWGRRAAAFSPTDETVLRRLLILLDRLGDRGGVVRAYEAFASNLEREYELQPSPETQELLAALRGRGPRIATATAAAAAPGSMSTPDASAASRANTVITDGPRAIDEPTVPPQAVVVTPKGRRRDRLLRYATSALVLGAVLIAATLVGLTARGRDAAAVQDEIARTVGRELDRRFGNTAVAPVRRPRTGNVAAYELYRLGSDRTRLRSDSAAREGMELLQEAVTLDSTFAAAWAGLSLMSHRAGLVQPPVARERYWRIADHAARKAVALDDALADGHLMLAKMHMVDFDFAAAERELKHAIRLDPLLTEPHQSLVTLHLWMDRPADALAHAERAVALDPLAPAAHAERARALLGLDRCDDALAALDTLAKLRPPLLRVADIAAHCYARKRMWSAAIAALRPQAEQGLTPALAQTAYLLGRAGRRDEAAEIQAELLERWRRGEEGAFHVGLAYAGLGDVDRAVECFERAVADRSLHGAVSTGQLMLVLPGPLADDLRRHAGFQRLRTQLGLQRQ